MMSETPKQPKVKGTNKTPLDKRVAESKFVKEAEKHEAEMRSTEKPVKPPLGPSVKSPD